MINQCHFGHVFDVLPRLAGLGARCCVTSTPYWGLRDYGVDGQLGHEPTPEEFVANMVRVFRLVWDVLADDGTLWLNLGDSYNSAASGQNGTTGSLGGGVPCGGKGTTAGRIALCKTIKHKDLVGIPWLVAFALRADGWYLRQDIIWSKPNPMPESVRDRCTKAHEYLFLLSKRERYYYDAEAVSEKAGGGGRFNGSPSYADGDRNDAGRRDKTEAMTRNRHSVWTVATKPYSGAHFATFPPNLIKPCILAGSAPGDIVLDPFLGSGTTAMVAQSLGRRWVGCELNSDYEELQRERTGQLGIELS